VEGEQAVDRTMRAGRGGMDLEPASLLVSITTNASAPIMAIKDPAMALGMLLVCQKMKRGSEEAQRAARDSKKSTKVQCGCAGAGTCVPCTGRSFWGVNIAREATSLETPPSAQGYLCLPRRLSLEKKNSASAFRTKTGKCACRTRSHTLQIHVNPVP
jgi:hypothetical protein